MIGAAFRNPKVRRAYVLTKVGVFAGAAAMTWPLSRMIGNKAWIGLAIFGAVLLTLTVVVLAATGKADEVDNQPAATSDEDHEPPPLTPDPVVLTIEDNIDLHSFPPRDIPSVVDAYLEEAVAQGFTEVRLIHGRGIGLQRERVQSLLSGHPHVRSYHDAPPERGGWGATIAHLIS